MPDDGRIPANISPQFGHRDRGRERERRIGALATRQHGVVALPQLVALGLSSRAVRSRVEAGRLHRVHSGVYALGRPDLPIGGRWMAAVLACGEGALLSHRSAAALLRLLGAGGGAIDVTIPHRRYRSRPGIRVHRSTAVTAADRGVVEGIPCTSVARTLLDLAAVVPQGVLARACNQAEIRDLLDMAAVRELLARSPRRPGARRLRSVVERGDAAVGVPRTVLERRFLALCQRTGLPLPSVNQWLSIPGEEMECDFVWYPQRVVVEVDGWDTHRTRQAFHEDRRRDRLLRLRGWQVSRFTWDDVTEASPSVAEQVRTMLAIAPNGAARTTMAEFRRNSRRNSAIVEEGGWWTGA